MLYSAGRMDEIEKELNARLEAGRFVRFKLWDGEQDDAGASGCVMGHLMDITGHRSSHFEVPAGDYGAELGFKPNDEGSQQLILAVDTNNAGNFGASIVLAMDALRTFYMSKAEA